MLKQIATTVIFVFWSGIYLLFGSLKPYYCLPYILVFCCILLSGKMLWSTNKIICQGPSHVTVILWRVGSLAPDHKWNRGTPLARTPWSPHVARICGTSWPVLDFDRCGLPAVALDEDRDERGHWVPITATSCPSWPTGTVAGTSCGSIFSIYLWMLCFMIGEYCFFVY
jgi:hypothetical protein